MFRSISEEEIRLSVSMPTAIGLMKEAFRQLSSGLAQAPDRMVMDSDDRTGTVLFMPSYSPAFDLFGLKMVSVFRENSKHTLPVIQGKMMVMDGKTGSPLAVLDAEYLTALRTGAATGLATDLLARKEAHVLAVFGTGAQAVTQIEAVVCVRSITEVIVFGHDAFGHDTAKTKVFCDTLSQKLGATIRAARSREELKKADVVCLATTSPTPVIARHELSAGVHINGIGSYKPEMREIPSDVICQSLLIVDHRSAALSEAGDILIPIQEGLITENHIAAELGEIVSGKKTARTGVEQITVFKSVGNAIQDLAIANYIVRQPKG